MLSLICASSASAQFDRLDDLASKITKELKPFKPHLVAVVDFRSPDDSTKPQGHYFAWILSSYLEERSKHKFAVASHVDFDKDLANLNVSSSTLVPGEALQSAAPRIGADVLITGTIEKRGNSYVVVVIPIRVSDEKPQGSLTATIIMSPFLESLVTPLPALPRFSGKNLPANSTMPGCRYCPDPSYSNLARSERIQGTCIMEVLISEGGEAQQVRPIKLLGYGLDEQAFDVIKRWKFKPATRDGTPVAVIVPVEVTFRLF
jgi:TonB family protein